MNCKILQKDYGFKIFLVFLALMFIDGSMAFGQESITITGKVTSSADNGPLPGVTVLIKGTKTGATTNTNGIYTIKAGASTILVFSYTGFEQKEVAVDGKTSVNVKLAESTAQLGEVVVTALGIESKSSRLSYSTQEVGGKELTKVPQTNFMNSLTGKVSGAAIYRNSSGVGGSVKVLIRGNKSAQGNNQPLYVINGVPMTNIINESMNGSFSSSDQGDGISNLNPDDIESISILKGASAAALYGSQAANGVILITTKKGKAGTTKVEFSSSLTLDKIAYKPELQNSYGQTAPGSEESWGAPITNAKDNISDFFNTGQTWTNAISFSSGSEKQQTYISYANTTAKGVLPSNDLSRHNISIRQNSRFLNDKLIVDANINFVNQTVNNTPVSGFQATSLYGLYSFPRGLDFDQYKNYERFDPIRNVNLQNWPFINSSNQNPYWLANKVLTANKRNRAIANLSAKYNITNYLNFQLRGSVDRTDDDNSTKYYVGTDPAWAGENGGYNVLDMTNTQYYADALLSYNRTYGKINLNAVLGSSITDSFVSGVSAASTIMYVPNYFTIQNMNPINGGYASSLSPNHQQLQAAFASVGLTYNDWLSFTVTGRNDWSSNLSFTPNGSYFYPSYGVSALLSEALNLPDFISYAKIRGSYAIVGNTVPVYVTNPQNSIDGRGNVVFNNTAPFDDLKPEKTKSYEFGTELRFLEDRFSLDFTYYKTNTINQFFSISVPPGTGYSRRFINGGDIENSGVEIVAGYNVMPEKGFKWNTTVNFSANRNEVKKLATSIDQFVISNDINNYFSILKVGGSYGDIYGQVLQRDDQGRLVIAPDGTPRVKPGAPSYLGNSNPKFQLGWNNSFNYKDFSLSFLFDGSFGGKIMSLTEQVLDGFGVSKRSGDARINGGVAVNGIEEGTGKIITSVDPSKYYHTIGGIQHVTGEYMYDATTIRLREVSLGYTLPKTLIKNNDFVKSIRLSLIGRNLAYLYKKAPIDPESIFSSGNGYSGIEVFSLPATRSFGLSVNVTF